MALLGRADAILAQVSNIAEQGFAQIHSMWKNHRRRINRHRADPDDQRGPMDTRFGVLEPMTASFTLPRARWCRAIRWGTR